jgi:subtilase family serine protease
MPRLGRAGTPAHLLCRKDEKGVPLQDRFASARRRLAVIAVPTGAAVALTLAPTALAAGRADVAGGRPVWAHSSADRGAAPASAPVAVRVYLAPKGGTAALDRAVAAVSTPGSPQYHQFLTPAQYRARFGPRHTTVAGVRRWLAGSGLKVTRVARARRWVAARGTVAAAQRAFHTRVHQYRHAGRTVQAPTSAVSVPARLGSAVTAVTGLDTSLHLVRPADMTPPPAGFRNPRPCSTYFGEKIAKFEADGTTPLPKFQGQYVPYATCGYTPNEYRSAYLDGGNGLTGAGVNVAILDAYAAETIRKDTNIYSQRHGIPTFTPGQFQQRLPSSFRLQDPCDPEGWTGEETLDVQAVHGMAPAAGIRYYAARSCTMLDAADTLDRIVDDNDVSIVSNSYGDTEVGRSAADVAAFDQAFKQGAMQGIGFFFSSGDDGDELAATGTKQTDFPADDPLVTAVGGTADAIGADGHFLFQTGWGTERWVLSPDNSSWQDSGFLYGAGGGVSALFPRPDYQNGVVPPTSGRAVPDIAYDADPNTGMLVGQTQVFPHGTYYDEYRIGGTSLASPLMSGTQALAEQHAGGRLGFANPAIYAQARSGAATLRDVVHTGGPGVVRPAFNNGWTGADGISYTLRTFDDDSSLQTNAGWDDVTGNGTPTAAYLTSQHAH